MKNLINLLLLCFISNLVFAQNVGIGNVSPQMKLHVTNNDSAIALFENTQTLASGVGNSVYLKTGNYFTGAIKTTGTASNFANMGFYTYAATSGNGLIERLTISDAGNVGIGIKNPQYKLDVTGRSRISGTGSGSGQAGLWMDDYRDGSNSFFIGKIDSTRAGFFGQSNLSSAGWGLQFDTKNGNIGIGRAPYEGTSNVRLALDHPNGAAAYFMQNGAYRGGIVATNYGLEISALGGSTICSPAPCVPTPPKDIIFWGSPCNVFPCFATQGNIGMFTDTPKTDVHMNATVLIGGLSTQPVSGYRLSVEGKVICEELKVQLKASWPDYVFDKEYRLTPLNELAATLQRDKHLPGIPSAASVELEKGFSLGEMQRKSIEKIEELYLYVIQLHQENETLKARIQKLEEKQP